MSLAGKLSAEIGIHTPAATLFNFYTTQLHHIQNISDTVHATKLHQGDEWHSNDSIKHWTYTVEGKVVTCHEIMESIDEQNKTITFKLFGEDIDQHFKVFKLIFQTMNKNDGSATIKWTIEFEKIMRMFNSLLASWNSVPNALKTLIVIFSRESPKSNKKKENKRV
ncbi:kirola-like [Abrus precatorius]|uniref:Kirola-like n=1 Tax=Abrus precatorius TaxID=3816 RepID=A0A8B8LLJ5_ABRPR|nr:kirola-like [Abrus precatorius]